MSELKLKVCGMKDPENIKGLIDLHPNFMGFIFYPKSPRYSEEFDEDLINQVPIDIQKVGVFVNEKESIVISTVKKYGLDYAQLHGDEDLEYVQYLKANGVKIIKVFRILDSLPSSIKTYDGLVDYFLFDTATSAYGGSGKRFDWDILRNYHLKTPFLLSGGIEVGDIEKIKSMNIKNLVGIDVNSRFEIEPGLKDLELIKELKEEI